MATVKDVAREAGVSLGTVSNVLNNRPSVKEKNRAAVMAAIEKLGFVSDVTARTLRTRSSRSIGLIIPTITNPFYPEFARGVEDAAFRSGLTVFLCNCDRDSEKERYDIRQLLQKRVDGLILARPRISREECESLCQKTGLVLLGPRFSTEGLRCGTVRQDMKKGTLDALELLTSLGHKRIAWIAGVCSVKTDFRFQIYEQYLKEKQIPYHEEYVAGGRFSWKGGYQAGLEFMKLEHPPTAILAANDMMAIGAMKAVRESGRRIPEDVSIIGCDNIEMADLVFPPLTTLETRKYEMGVRCVELMEQMLDPAQESGIPFRMETELIKRKSVAAANAEE